MILGDAYLVIYVTLRIINLSYLTNSLAFAYYSFAHKATNKNAAFVKMPLKLYIFTGYPSHFQIANSNHEMWRIVFSESC